MTTKSKQLVRAGHDLASELKADCGAVDVRSVANLLTELASALDVQSARSDALAVDNSALNKFIKDDCWIWDDKSEEYFDAADCMPETPATDAWVNEQRAKGIEMLSDKYRAQLAALSTTSENMFDAAHVTLRRQIFDAEEFAAQLRGSQV